MLSILLSLLLIPFLAAKTVAAGLHRLPLRFVFGKKDVVYSLLADGRIRWERLVLAVGLHAERITRSPGGNDELRYFILDDTLKAKRGKAMELVSYLFDHVSGKNILGFQFLVLAYLSGKRLFPISFRLRVGAKRPEGTQPVLGDGRTCAGQRRRSALNTNKIKQASVLLREAAAVLPASFVLCDSW